MNADTGLSIIAPCYNEQGNIHELVRRVDGIRDDMNMPLELVLIDDGSTDDTWQEIQRAREQYPFVAPVRHHGNAGIVVGWQSGLDASRGRYVVTIDADLQYRPEDIAGMLQKMQDSGAEVVQGARVVEVQRSALRRFLTTAFSWLLNLVFGMRLQDNKSGFILYRREVLADVLDTRANFVYFQHFIAVAAHALGYRIAEVPVVFDPRHSGDSYIQQPLRFSLRALRDLPRAIWRFRLAKRRKTG